jgi:hypothetical protein
MKKFSPAQVKSAVDRLPRQSNASIDQVLVNARRLEIEPLVEACQSELRTRGSLKLSGAEAEQALEISEDHRKGIARSHRDGLHGSGR